jgi:hypothetical protein
MGALKGCLNMKAPPVARLRRRAYSRVRYPDALVVTRSRYRRPASIRPTAQPERRDPSQAGRGTPFPQVAGAAASESCNARPSAVSGDWAGTSGLTPSDAI